MELSEIVALSNAVVWSVMLFDHHVKKFVNDDVVNYIGYFIAFMSQAYAVYFIYSNFQWVG